MKITIVTAVWNGAKTIVTALESVARQRTEVKVGGECDGEGVGVGERRIEIEHIVVDGGSTDGTVELVRKFADQQVKVRGECKEGTEFRHSTSTSSTYTFRWLSEKDNGLYDAINKGIKMATGDVIGICNADDVLDGDDVIARIAREFKPVLDCVYGKVRFVNELGGRTVRRCFARLWRPWMLQWGYMPPHPGVFIRRECFEKWNYYEPKRTEYKIAADYELLIRYFRVHRMRAKYSGICTTIMRTGGVSTRDVNARKVLNEEIIKANRTNGYFCCWPMLLPKYAIKVWEVILPKIGLDGRSR